MSNSKPVPRPAPKPSAKPAPKPSANVASKGGNNNGGSSRVGVANNKPAPRPAPKPTAKPSPKPSANVAARGGNAAPSRVGVANNNPAPKPVAKPSGQQKGRPAANPSNRPSANVASRGNAGPSRVGVATNSPIRANTRVTAINRAGGGGANANANVRRPDRINTVASRVMINTSPRGGSAGGGAAHAYRHHGGGWGVWRPDYRPDYYRRYSPSFYYSVNYAYRPYAWGGYPWWGARHHYTWHSGCWNYGWNSRWVNRYSYYRRPALYYPPGYRTHYVSPVSFVPWGLASWTLGRLAYDSGYYTYYNPYVAPPVTTQTTIIRYAEPITVVASNTEPATEEIATTNAEKASAAMELARAAFKDGDYVASLGAVDEAISHTPGDQVLHEFRALNLFALGRYNDAAGVLNPVLASGPGWDWDTLIGFYGNADSYTDQFRKLEDYVVANPNAPEPHFLLGYHYLVGENLTEAHAMFDQVVALQPADSVAKQLRALLAESAPENEEVAVAEGSAPVEPKKPTIAEDALHGVWKAKSAEGKLITLSLTAIGTFTWNYEGSSGEILSGEWSLDEDGLLVLADEDVQMVGDVTLKDDGSLHFLLAGSPTEDPGLTFLREP